MCQALCMKESHPEWADEDGLLEGNIHLEAITDQSNLELKPGF